MLGKKKKRVFQHIMEDSSFELIKSVLPKEWVVRKFNHPDYGIDIVIELFNSTENEGLFETLGEYIYVQVKSIKSLEVEKVTLNSVLNVSKFEWTENSSKSIEVDVVKYSIETSLLETVFGNGSSIPVLLFLADLSSKKIYFICLNDIIDKLIIPERGELNQDSITINIPILNELSNVSVCHTALKIYGKRAKFLAAFSKMNYQRHEILRYEQIADFMISKHGAVETLFLQEFEKMLRLFMKHLLALDFWELNSWVPLKQSKSELIDLQINFSLTTENFEASLLQIKEIWFRLCNLNNMYEELVREWYLPKHLSYLMSYR